MGGWGAEWSIDKDGVRWMGRALGRVEIWTQLISSPAQLGLV